ncbi:MAG: tetratricopeptide repeat protein [Nostoc sp.]|uniref:tetratricopeptide repeat protein n=1 Tax=Nostoc sp. TaxID=1180 RepID=UPI002FF045EB
MSEPSENIIDMFQQAMVLQDAGKFNEAVDYYNNVLAIDPCHVESWINKGLALWRLEYHEAALQSYNSALEFEPRNAIAWMNKGNTLSSLGQDEEALSCYDRALEIDPLMSKAWYNKGDELGRRKRVIEAKACFENAYNLGLSQAQEMIVRCEQILMNEWYG